MVSLWRACCKKGTQLFLCCIVACWYFCCYLALGLINWDSSLLFLRRFINLLEFKSFLFNHCVPSNPVRFCFRCSSATNYTSHERLLYKDYIVAYSQHTAIEALRHRWNVPLFFNVEWVCVGYLPTFACNSHHYLVFCSLDDAESPECRRLLDKWIIFNHEFKIYCLCVTDLLTVVNFFNTLPGSWLYVLLATVS